MFYTVKKLRALGILQNGHVMKITRVVLFIGMFTFFTGTVRRNGV
jgi:hypothetical protein